MTKCAYCREPIQRKAVGRKPRFCKPSCRQRAYERRQWRSKTGLRSQPTRSYVSDDAVMTPPRLAKALAAALKPSGVILEPAAGTGNFVRALRRYGVVKTCEQSRGRDFYHWTERVDWIVTNPPWSQFRRFLEHALTVADRIAFVCTLNHLWTRSRRQLVTNAGFGIERIIEFEPPKEWGPRTGFQTGMVMLRHGHEGPCTLEKLPPS